MNLIQIISFALAYFVNNLIASEFTIFLKGNKIKFDFPNKQVQFLSKNYQKVLLSGAFGNRLKDYSDYDIRSLNDSLKIINFQKKNSIIELSINSNKAKIGAENITCTTIRWRLKKQRKIEQIHQDEFEDCFKINSGYWYGGSEMNNQQYWPINKQVIKFI